MIELIAVVCLVVLFYLVDVYDSFKAYKERRREEEFERMMKVLYSPGYIDQCAENLYRLSESLRNAGYSMDQFVRAYHEAQQTEKS